MDISRFVPVWESEQRKALRTWDFEEKWQAFHTSNGRPMACAHRGDRNQLYPENSWQAFCSAVLYGADMLEADIHVTRDGIPVVMHDDTLTRTTDLPHLRAAGAAWLPASDLVADWTVEEIRRLHTVMPDGTVTACTVPTLEELILLAKDRCFVTLDKAGAFSFEVHVMPLLEKHDAWRTVLIPYEYPFDRVVAIKQEIARRSGVQAPYFAKAVKAGKMEAERMVSAQSFLQEEGYAPVLRGGEFEAENEALGAFLQESVKGKYRLYAESLQAAHDHEANWRSMIAAGCNILMGNRNYELIDFVRRYNGEA